MRPNCDLFVYLDPEAMLAGKLKESRVGDRPLRLLHRLNSNLQLEQWRTAYGRQGRRCCTKVSQTGGQKVERRDTGGAGFRAVVGNQIFFLVIRAGIWCDTEARVSCRSDRSLFARPDCTPPPSLSIGTIGIKVFDLRDRCSLSTSVPLHSSASYLRSRSTSTSAPLHQQHGRQAQQDWRRAVQVRIHGPA